ncbi:hemolysin-type calcium binding protein [hydrocarbon metagenome]|uniref:Hemolysin-type calcium binding protein n=1 Tax=hydrocarbon metagenome TaxID=938273 RepID=A0A0W8FLE7_9ZZZZ
MFSLTVSDGTGTSAPATITIEIVDDMPKLTVAADSLTVDEDGLPGHAEDGTPLNTGEVTGTGSASATGNLIDNFNFGADGPATTPVYSINGQTAGADGHIVINGTGYILDVDVVTGNYTFTLTDNLIHDPIQGENLQALLANGIDLNVVVQDADGDQVAGTVKLNVNVLDDMPTALSKEHDIQVELPVTTAQISALASGWDAPFDGNVDTKTNSDDDPYYEKIAWGDNTNSSSYEFNDNASLSNVSIGEAFTLGTFTHNNFPIPSGSSITDAYLRVTFDVVIDGQTVHIDKLVRFQHNETPNTNDPVASADIVTIVNGSNVVPITVGDFTYTLTIGFKDAVGNTVTTVNTAENASTSFSLVGELTPNAEFYTPPVTGEVDASFGADGPADLKVVSVAHDANGDGIDEIYNTSSSGYNTATNTLTIETEAGGTFAMNFLTGEYTYTPPAGTPLVANETFTYTVADADGDVASAGLTFNLPVEDMLVAGTNVDDQTGQTVGHYIDNKAPFDGPITGGGGNDILVGDIGGYSTTAGKSLNLSLVLDTSGSMTEKITFNGQVMTRLEALKISVNNTLTDLANGSAENVRVQIVDFSTNSSQLGIYDLKNSSELAAAIKAINSLDAEGGTNYEAGLQKALGWANSTGTDAPLTGTNVISQVIFISDGEPNYYYRGDTTSPGLFNYNLLGPGSGFDQTALNHILPVAGDNDTISEVQQLIAKGFTIDAVGINVSATNLDHLNQVEGASAGVNPDVATNITTGEQLNQVLTDLTQHTTLNEAGDDNILSGDGNDIIFGDSVNTDSLADSQGLTTPDGAGWEVFEKLGWTEQQIIDYIKANHATLSAESGRTGGDDTINAGAGNDVVYGQEGDDTINGGAGDDILSGGTGNNILNGGSGADTFVISKGGYDTIQDYSQASLDKVDISSVLDESVGDHLNVIANTDGSARLQILDSTNAEKASVSFDNIQYSDLGDMGAGHELDSLLGKVDVDQ